MPIPHALATLAAAALLMHAACAATLAVHPGERIGAALAAARPGDTVLVQHGRYEENLRIDKPLTLRGVGRPTIDGRLAGDVIRVAAPDVTISGFSIVDSGASLTAQNAGVYVAPGSDRARIEHCELVYNLFGLWIERSADVRVTGNVIVGKRDLLSPRRGNGIQLYNTTGARIAGNTISYTRDGIYVDVSHHARFEHNTIHDVRYGTHYMNSYYNVWDGNDVYHNRGGLAIMEARDQIVRGNRVWGNTDHGIMLRTIQDSLIENNVVAGNQRGLFIYDAEYNTIRGNLVVDNKIGVHLWGGSIHNDVTGNDFADNREQIRYVAASDVAWPGNYWSNYLGWDRRGRGVGDVPYKANDLVDRLTWRVPSVKVLMNSPAVQALRVVARQFPLLAVPSVVDDAPRMRAAHAGWPQWVGKR
ncbi:nitrous oxide reductase family maturation protein NosD [Burkholderia pseudomallei]|uniref:nitrous oxide reductase family maturation protein NosD n=1 Tax=Burkholderia pseudomallei TaxID=28450 RepID=UPI00050E43BD|nr:nitrous oxide reductase family maturation protein NosD [Burkholderia pseudomallei]KGC32404.1 nitrous oxide reductase maturation NosD family protein [Burkholderia pseudomallei]KGD32314.1 nitrous oxide reductase maturation NosD family protein [Burkholderia pseudomallei]MBO3037137.1 nitrous oxide reductase family maturation protein NosD [Burkholderia pseudomallei]PJO61116.1 nitrous oxide reductase family maturation protein NosD [Burkholderia pseudomallei]CAJ4052517.1 copper ABC transporter per